MNSLLNNQSGFIQTAHMTPAQLLKYAHTSPYHGPAAYASYLLNRFNDFEISESDLSYIQHTYYGAIVLFLLHDHRRFPRIWSRLSVKNRTKLITDLRSVYHSTHSYYYYSINETDTTIMMNWIKNNIPELTTHITFLRPMPAIVATLRDDMRILVRQLIRRCASLPNTTLCMNLFVNWLNEPTMLIYHHPPPSALTLQSTDLIESMLEYVRPADYETVAISCMQYSPDHLQYLGGIGRFDLVRIAWNIDPSQAQQQSRSLIRITYSNLFHITAKIWADFVWCYTTIPRWLYIDSCSQFIVSTVFTIPTCYRTKLDFLYDIGYRPYMTDIQKKVIDECETITECERDDLLYWIHLKRAASA